MRVGKRTICWLGCSAVAWTPSCFSPTRLFLVSDFQHALSKIHSSLSMRASAKAGPLRLACLAHTRPLCSLAAVRSPLLASSLHSRSTTRRAYSSTARVDSLTHVKPYPAEEGGQLLNAHLGAWTRLRHSARRVVTATCLIPVHSSHRPLPTSVSPHRGPLILQHWGFGHSDRLGYHASVRAVNAALSSRSCPTCRHQPLPPPPLPHVFKTSGPDTRLPHATRFFTWINPTRSRRACGFGRAPIARPPYRKRRARPRCRTGEARRQAGEQGHRDRRQGLEAPQPCSRGPAIPPKFGESHGDVAL